MKLKPEALLDCLKLDLEGYLVPGVKTRTALPPDVSAENFAATALLEGLLKKLEITSDTADSKALLKFVLKDEECSRYKFSPKWEIDYQLYGEFRRELDDFFHPKGRPLIESYAEIFAAADLGPGSNVGADGQSFYAKMFSSTLTTTNQTLYDMYAAMLGSYPIWCSAELRRLETHGFPLIVEGSRSVFVPKDVSISRLICVEPTLNMFVQLGIGNILRARLKSMYSIDLEYQPSLNRELAAVGSSFGSFSTIDLESASDSISLNLLKGVLPGWFFDTLVETRSPSVELPGLGYRTLSMVSTMGNGYTFPLQTVIFACALRAVYSCFGLKIRNNRESKANFGARIRKDGNLEMLGCVKPGNWAVFGDDIICETQVYTQLCSFLNLLGFSVNKSKSFFEGPFRESCGHDYFNGHWVRAVYLKRLDTRQQISVAINLLNEWSARTGISLRKTVRHLLDSFPGGLPNLVPFVENHDAGVRVPSAHFQNFRPKPGQMYRTYIVKPRQIRLSDEGVIHTPRGCKKLSNNPDGLLISFLRGEITNCTISIRSDVTRYKTKVAWIPSWDMCDERLASERGYSWQRWESATLANLA